ncbi:MAG: phosphoglycolate phosphatase [Betaproteobacteria bacterium]|nr:MAG: phosphoglycolate phosphatase [Betaproteobacteria bacterium]
MPFVRGIAAVMIDLDGTLLDTVPDIAAAAARMLAALGLPDRTQDEIRSFIGKGIPNLVQRCMPVDAGDTRGAGLQAEALALFQEFYFEESGRRTSVYPGVIEGLARFRDLRLRLACVTNKVARFTVPLLEHMGLASSFELVVSGDTLARKKPDPLQLVHICAEFALPPAKVLLIGDSVNDVLAARAAGCPVVCVSYGYNEGGDVHDLDCDAIVGSLLEAANFV